MTFIAKFNEVKETYGFLHPRELQRVVLTFCSSFYGSNLWDLGSDECRKIFNLWNSSVRDLYDVPRNTRTYIVENLLSTHHGFKVDLMTRYQKFYTNLLKSPSYPVRILSAMLRSDVRSCSGRNIAFITDEAGVDPLSISKGILTKKLDKKREIPENEAWVLDEINDMLGLLMMMKHNGIRGEEENQIKDMVDCLCSA